MINRCYLATLDYLKFTLAVMAVSTILFIVAALGSQAPYILLAACLSFVLLLVLLARITVITRGGSYQFTIQIGRGPRHDESNSLRSKADKPA
jgi:hypothetical protein